MQSPTLSETQQAYDSCDVVQSNMSVVPEPPNTPHSLASPHSPHSLPQHVRRHSPSRLSSEDANTAIPRQLFPHALRSINIPNPNEEIAVQVYNQLKELVSGQIHQDNIVKIVGLAIQIVQRMKRDNLPLSNEEKKSIVIVVIHRIVQDVVKDDTVRGYLEDIFIPMLLPGIIDSLCDLNVNDIKQSLLSCWKC